MLKILVIIEDKNLKEALISLDIWDISGFELTAVHNDLAEAFAAEKGRNFNLVISQFFSQDMNETIKK